ncbi:retrovirus-related pol polyprotein from transposon TNT 1-94 [Tanacetum coccineum]
MQDPKDSSDPTTAMNMEIALLAKAFKVNAIPTNNNQRSSLIPCNSQIAQSGMNTSQDIKMQMVDDNVGNQVRQNAVQNMTPVEGNGNGINGNPIRCYNYRGKGHYASNCTVKPRKRDATYLQQQLQIAQEKEAGIQSTQEEFDFMAAAGAYGSAEVHLFKNYYDNDIFNMFTQEEQGTVEQHPVTVEETSVHQESLFHNLVAEVEKVNSVNRKMKETNAELTIELARYKNQEKYFEISQEKYDKLERCYQQFVYQEQCLLKRINALHLSSGKQITALNEEISNLNKQLSKEKSTVTSLQEEKKRLKSNLKIHEDELLDKQIQLENKIKELDNILVKTGQSIQTMHMLSPKPDSFYHSEHKMALGYQNPFYLKKAQQKQQSLYNGKVLLEKHDPPAVYDSDETLELAQETKSREELYFSNTSKTADVSKSISIPNEKFSDDATPSVERKFLNEVKSTIVTLQRVVKQRMTLDIHNWSSSAHQEIHKIVKDEILPIINQVDARVQNFKIQFLKEATKFVRDFKSLAKEADESLVKYKALELEIERLLRAVVSQDIMSVVQNNSVVDTSNLQTELERTKER